MLFLKIQMKVFYIILFVFFFFLVNFKPNINVEPYKHSRSIKKLIPELSTNLPSSDPTTGGSESSNK